jgi:PHD/YefM family antitoxin component YafN of YafNO toxin-antitoxin module
MMIHTKAIVSNSDMNKNYRACREKAESCGKIFILKNNQPEAVLFSVSEYERISEVVEYLEKLSESELEEFIKYLPKIIKNEQPDL